MAEFQPGSDYKESVRGTIGTFAAPTADVAYVMTKARLGAITVDPERRLTQHLRPFREVIAAKDLDFAQLLQRDLDDQRVATKLIPYLLGIGQSGPVFFPPILTVLLPFLGNDPTGGFPEAQAPVQTEADGAIWETTRYGDAFQWEVMCQPDGSRHPSALGRLWWNTEKAKLVVLDGQHRAMALLAIDRTLTRTWRGDHEKYRTFYESHVMKYVETDGREKVEANLNRIEIPVSVAWFVPPLPPGVTPHSAARKLFVDVNKEAKAPSPSRLVLLSDNDLYNIFTRSVLSMTRAGLGNLPLEAIEYDNPNPEAARPKKVTASVNLQLVKSAVLRSVFGPRRLLADMESVISKGRLPEYEMDGFMRAKLELNDFWPAEISDGPDKILRREDIGHLHFPLSRVDELTKVFERTWGVAILDILGRLRPYHIHSEALRTFENEWTPGEMEDSLARDALVEGVGMYWMLQEAAADWKRLPQLLRPTKPPVVAAWERVETKEKEFLARRHQLYWPEDPEAAKSAYEQFNTFACQLGAILAFGALAFRTKTRRDDIPGLAKTVVSAWNALLDGEGAGGGPGRLVLSRDVVPPLNLTTELNTNVAVQFRYLWIELLRAPVSREVVGTDLAAAADSLVVRGRKAYMQYAISDTERAIQKANPEWSDERTRSEATARVRERLATGLEYWTGLTRTEFDRWEISTAADVPQGTADDLGESEEEMEGPEDSDLAEEPGGDDESP